MSQGLNDRRFCVPLDRQSRKSQRKGIPRNAHVALSDPTYTIPSSIYLCIENNVAVPRIRADGFVSTLLPTSMRR